MTPRSYGHVYLGRYKETGQLLAIKMMKMISDMHSIKKEIHMLKDCDCNHVVRYFGSYLKDDHVWIVIEYCGGGSLRDLTQKGKFPLRENEICYILSGMLIGLLHIHERSIIHRVSAHRMDELCRISKPTMCY